MALKIQTTAYAALKKGLTNDEVLAAVLKRHPNAHTTLGCISYYRSKMNKELDVTQRIPQRAAAAEVATVAVSPTDLKAQLLRQLEKLTKIEQEIYELESQVLAAHTVAA